MKYFVNAAAAAALLLAPSLHAQTAIPAPFKTSIAATSYAVGVDMVRNFKSQSVNFDLEQLIQGIKDAGGDGKPLLSDADVKRLVASLETDVRGKMAAVRKAEGDTNLKSGESYLKANAARPGVVTLASGLQYKIEKAGAGAKPVDDSTVLANYKGMLTDGSTFDASEAGKPASFKVSQVIPGWKEALKLMPAGSKWELTIPPSMAYGERGAGKIIGPNQVLRFEVELLEVR